MLAVDSYIFFDIVQQVLRAAGIPAHQMGIGLVKNPHATVKFEDSWLEFKLEGQRFTVTFGDGSKAIDLADPDSIQQIIKILLDIKARY